MLDAYIIDRIQQERRREKEEREGAFVPLHIEVPLPAPPDERSSEESSDSPDRGSTVIDFHV